MKQFLTNGITKLNYNFNRINPRSSFKYVLNKFPSKKLICAEVGVYKGINAKSMLKTGRIEKLYLIDKYKDYRDYNEEWITQEDLNNAKKEMLNKLKEFDNIVFIEKDSLIAFDELPELDYIYLDANHSYEYTKREMVLYFNKLKKGGVMGGHDVCAGFSKECEGVTRAFVEFCYENKLKPFLCNNDWWVEKD